MCDGEDGNVWDGKDGNICYGEDGNMCNGEEGYVYEGTVRAVEELLRFDNQDWRAPDG